MQGIAARVGGARQPYLIFAAQTETAKFLATFKDFPPRQRAASFGVDQAVEKTKQNLGGN